MPLELRVVPVGTENDSWQQVGFWGLQVKLAPGEGTRIVMTAPIAIEGLEIAGRST
jgi:hypothetical protein